MWTHRIRSFHKWFSRLGPPSLLLLHLHELPKWAVGIFRAKISGTFTATTLLMPQKPLGGLSPLPNFGASTDGLRLWAFWGLGEALHFHVIFSLLPVPCLCLPSKLNRAVLFFETNTCTYTIHSTPIPKPTHIHIQLHTCIYIYINTCTCMYIYIYLHTYTYIYMRVYIYNAIWITQGPIQKLCNNNLRKLGKATISKGWL